MASLRFGVFGVGREQFFGYRTGRLLHNVREGLELLQYLLRLLVGLSNDVAHLSRRPSQDWIFLGHHKRRYCLEIEQRQKVLFEFVEAERELVQNLERNGEYLLYGIEIGLVEYDFLDLLLDEHLLVFLILLAVISLRLLL